MAAGTVKSIEKTQKSSEPSSPTRGHARQSSVGISQGAFDSALVPQMAGNLAVQQLFRAGAIQAKLAISQPNDPDEQEADRVADQVMRMAEPTPISSAPSTIQRKCVTCAAGATTCPKCEEEEKLQRKETPDHAPQATPAIHAQIAALRGGGQPLPPFVRAFIEPRFGRDFSHVRVHTDSPAAESARAIQARAFTAGQDIAFGPGQFAPESLEGKRLLAHELIHTIQQRDGALSHQATCRIQRSPDADGPSIWDRISQGAKDAGSSVVAGAASVGSAVVQGVRDTGGAVVQGAESAGAAIAQGAKSAAGSVVQTVASAGSDLLALEEKLAKFNALLKDYSPLPDGLIRLKDEMLSEKARLSALGESLNTQAIAQLPGQVANVIPPVVGGVGAGAGWGGESGDHAGGCGLCYGEGEGKVGPREAGTAVHRVIQNIMIANPGIVAELPLGSGRVDLAVVRPELKQIEIGEIKPANSGGVEAGIDQIETRLRVLPTLAQYSGYTAVPLKYPVRQPLRFETGAPFCLEQPGFCFSQSLSVAGPIGGLYLYFCEPSYSELLTTGCRCKCKEPKPFPFPFPAKEREKERPLVVINWAKVATIAMIIALLVATIALAVCAFATGATVLGIPVAAICAVAGFATATAMLALLVKTRSEPDTVA